ncbi:MAG TPA: phage protease [Verrucomicrobiae bacterium]|nr:phage protease [Verrucomicrobiae bacterium]
MKSHVIIFNRAPLVSTNGWIHIVPKGELPNSEAKLVQVLDEPALDSILASIEKAKNRLGDNWPGIYAGREHFIYDPDKDSAALAWFKDFEKRDDGIWAKDDGLTPAGDNAVKNREYKFTSFVADRGDLKKIEGNKYRVMAIETVGFTNQANGKELLTPITNRSLQTATTFADEDPSAANQQKNNQVKQMKSIATKLGLAAEASEDAILAEVTKILNRATTAEAELTPLKNRKTELETQNQTLLGEQVDGILVEHKITDTKVINRLKPVLTGLKDRADRVGYLTDCGFKAGGEKTTTTRVLNRGTGAASAQTGEETDEAAEQERAVKVMNRATNIMKEIPSIGLATATAMAAREIK